jgi:hypothetical protein
MSRGIRAGMLARQSHAVGLRETVTSKQVTKGTAVLLEQVSPIHYFRAVIVQYQSYGFLLSCGMSCQRLALQMSQDSVH